MSDNTFNGVVKIIIIAIIGAVLITIVETMNLVLTLILKQVDLDYNIHYLLTDMGGLIAEVLMLTIALIVGAVIFKTLKQAMESLRNVVHASILGGLVLGLAVTALYLLYDFLLYPQVVYSGYYSLDIFDIDYLVYHLFTDLLETVIVMAFVVTGAVVMASMDKKVQYKKVSE